MQAQAAQRVSGGLAGHGAVDAMEMERREAGHRGKSVEIERIVEVLADVGDDALDAAAVVEDGERLGHGSSGDRNLRDGGLIAIAK